MSNHKMTADEIKDEVIFYDSTFIRWTAKKTLEFVICDPASAIQHFQNERFEAKILLQNLLDNAREKTFGKPLDFEEGITRDNKFAIVVSGNDAIEIALHMRDKLGKNFTGSTSIPQERAKN